MNAFLQQQNGFKSTTAPNLILRRPHRRPLAAAEEA
jgi:hypothetical protein